MYKGYGRDRVEIDPQSVDWENITWAEMNKIRMVQSPGDHNALGRVRILMKNEFNIYLHDTNHKELFENQDRTFSSGCVRMEDPARVANFILSGNEDWSADQIAVLTSKDELIEIEAEKTLPVYIVYQSVWEDGNGRFTYGPDVYKRDKTLIKKLAEVKAQHLVPQKEFETAVFPSFEAYVLQLAQAQ